MDEKYYLQEGEQTKITKRIKKISRSLKEDDKKKTIKNIISWIHKNLKKKSYDKKVFRKRTADEIIEDGYITGCTDASLVLIVMCRSLKIPAMYVEAKKEGEEAGHVWARIYINKKWIDVCPSSGKIGFKIDEFYRNKEDKGKYFEVETGLDSWDIGIKSINDWKEKAKEWEVKK